MATARDEYGFLNGELEYRGGPVIAVSPAIKPFLMQCARCNAPSFQVIGIEKAGIYFGFMGFKISKKPIVPLWQSRWLICNSCSVLVGKVSKEAVTLMEHGILPCEIVGPYSDEGAYGEKWPAIDFVAEVFMAGGYPSRDHLMALLRHYRRER